MLLNTTDHDRAIVGMTYVYPVVSRRAGGVSIGVNLNINNACNWRCIYCQVPNLKRGGPRPIDLPVLERELRHMLEAVLTGDFMLRAVPEGMRRLNDIALSGNGEPTSAPEFPEVIALIGRLMAEYSLLGQIKLILISNGSLMHRPVVQAGLDQINTLGGEVWFKIDRASEAGLRAINQTVTTPRKVLRNLLTCANHCPTWIQTCLFGLDGEPPGSDEIQAYLHLLQEAMQAASQLRGVLLYGLARPSKQPEAHRLVRLEASWLDHLAGQIEQLGLPVRISV